MNIIDIEKDYKKAIEKIWDKDEYEKSRWNKGNYEDFRTEPV